MKPKDSPDLATLLNRIIFVLSLIGVIMAIYVSQSFLRQAPIVCVNSGCEIVRKHPASYLFGTIPVPVVGLVGYSLLALLALARTGSKKPELLKAMLGIGLFGAGFVTWFTYTEIFIIKGICTWCAISAVNMYGILILVLKSYRLSTKK